MDNTIEKRIELKAPVSRVWRALTDYREFGAWFRVRLEPAAFDPKPMREYLDFVSAQRDRAPLRVDTDIVVSHSELTGRHARGRSQPRR